VEAVSVSCVKQLGVQDFGENAVEIPCGRPETEKFIERFLKLVDAALIIVMTADPWVTVTGSGLDSDRLDVGVAAAVRTVSEEDKLVEATESWVESAAIACR
jgi:hypothetical protein